MSPATKRKPGDPRRVVNSTSSVRVSVEAQGERVKVNWGCQHRLFSVEDMRRTIDWIDGIGTRHPLWLHPADSQNREYWITYENGKLFADVDPLKKNHGSVSWALLKRALQATVSEILSTTKQKGS